MRFSTPFALLLLALVPYFIWLGWPRLPHRRRRDIFSMVLRVLMIVLLVLGLAGLQTVQASDRLTVIFLLDVSDSIDQASRVQAQNTIRDAMDAMTPNDRAGIIVFGKNALVERPISTSKEFTGIASAPIRIESNLEEAMRLGMAMFPADTARRLVILSDGAETLGNAMEAARLAAATNIRVDVVPLQRSSGEEVLVSEVRLPSTVSDGETFDLGITVQSAVETPANITILSAGVVVQTRTENLKVGINNFVIPLRAPASGFVDFQVRVDPVSTNQTDTYYQNNTLSGFTQVVGQPRILLITKDPQEVAALLPALTASGLQVDVQAPSELPIGLAPLAAYKAVVLANVSAIDLNEQRMLTLQSYVRDLGGGLVVIGGPNSFGVGGYYQTPLEETLPVESQIKDQQRIPRLTMVYVIDRSGSMEIIGPSGITNLDLAKEAARRSVNFLFERDRVGILSFDSAAEWLVPIQFVASRINVINQIGSLRPGGGTDILAAVQELNRTLPSDPSTIKHVILLTDGGADPFGIVELVRKLHEQDGVTFTSIGIGTDVPTFMRDIARVGGGTYYGLADLANVPQIFAAETVLATRSYIVEDLFVPFASANSRILSGIAEIPQLRGYVATTAKPTATVVLTSPVDGYNDPLLATWQYGLGRAVAWTSDAAPRWSADWTSWENYGKFWSQVIRSTIAEGSDSAIEARVEQRGDKSVLIVEARDDQGAFINGLTLEGNIVDPRLQSTGLQLRQVAPGRYEAEFEPNREGAYFIRVAGSGVDQTIGVAQTTGWVLSYSPEYRFLEANTTLLEEMATIGNGRIVREEPGQIFRHDIVEERAAGALWMWLLLAAAFLLPLDIAIRRLIISQSDLQKLRAWLAKMFGQPQPATAEATASRLAALKEAKSRVVMPSAQDNVPLMTPPPTGEKEPPSKQPRPRQESQPRENAPAEDSGGSLAARLAEKRRKERE
jgi:uncharacterized membrane protein/secreted protein with Ig-like and vWFA domain